MKHNLSSKVITQFMCLKEAAAEYLCYIAGANELLTSRD